MKNLMYKVLFVFAFSLFSVGLAAQEKAPQKAKHDITTKAVDRPATDNAKVETTTRLGDARAERAKLQQAAKAERASEKAERKERKKAAKAEGRDIQGDDEKSKPKGKASKEKKANGWRSADHPGKGKALGRG